MEMYKIEQDIKVLCLLVPSFPAGIQEAFESMMNKLPAGPVRRFYGISYIDDKEQIVYKTAAEELKADEAEKYGYEKFTLKKGEYLTITILNWMQKLECIKDAFMTLMEDPRMDKTFPCVEWYKDDNEMMCMVKI